MSEQLLIDITTSPHQTGNKSHHDYHILFEGLFVPTLYVCRKTTCCLTTFFASSLLPITPVEFLSSNTLAAAGLTSPIHGSFAT